MKKLIASLLIINCLMLAGCFQQVDINDTVPVLAHGWDIEGQKKILAAQIALPSPSSLDSSGGSGDSQPKFMVLTSSGKSTVEAARRLSLSLPRTLIWSMTDSLVMSKAMAETDASIYVDPIIRNPRIRLNTRLFIATNAKPENVLQVEIPPEQYSGTALDKLVDTQTKIKGIYIPVDLKNFLFRLATEGIEPIAPQVIIVKKDGRDKLELSGTAVFRESRMVGSLNEQESRGLALLTPGAVSQSLIGIKSPLDSSNENSDSLFEEVVLEIGDYNTKTKPVFNGDKISFETEINVDVNLLEKNNDQSFYPTQATEALEKAAQEKLKADVMACINRAQNLRSDIFGWGLELKRRHPQKWRLMGSNWENIFSEAETKVSVNVNLRKVYLERIGFKFK